MSYRRSLRSNPFVGVNIRSTRLYGVPVVLIVPVGILTVLLFANIGEV